MRTLPLLLLAACAGGEELDPADLSVCAPPSPSEIGIFSEIRFSRVEDNVTRAFDLDGHNTEAGDDEGCGLPDMVGPNGETGLDNALARLIPALEQTEAGAVEALLQEAINRGALLLFFQADDVDDTQEDGCVDFTVLRGEGEAVIGTFGRIEPGQTFDIDTDIPSSTVPGVSIQEGALQAQGIEVAMPLTMFNVDLDFDLHNAAFLVEFNDNGEYSGIFAGGIEVAYLLEVTQRENVDPDLYGIVEPLLRAAADLAPDENGDCTQISVAFEFAAVPAFFYEDTP